MNFKIGDRVYHKKYGYGNIIDILLYSHDVMFDTVGKRIIPTRELKMAIEALKQESCEDAGEISDGYHTFNQLYRQRAILFATIVNQNTDIAWKSYKHSDGKYCFDSNGEWFIVGVDTPKGSYTYHYSKEYWDYFKCKELDCGKEWDGHTEEDATRLLSLNQEKKTGHWISHKEHCENLGVMPSGLGAYKWCSNCDCGIDVKEWHRNHYNYCPNCGAKMESED